MAKLTAAEWLTVLNDPNRRRSLRFGDLKKALQSVDALEVSRKGSHRTFKHPDYRDLITLVDRGNDPLKIGYVRDVRRLIECVLQDDDKGVQDAEVD